jgi:hypothetical protein
MANRLRIFLAGDDRGIQVDLEGRSSLDEFRDLEQFEGRWSELWVQVRREGTRTTYVCPDAIVKAEVDYAAPVSSEVAEKEELEAAKAQQRRAMGHAEPPYTDEPPARG